jgi:ABC-2 type transport system permease protein
MGGVVILKGFWTFVYKEIARFFVVPIQTIFTPLITAFLYLLVFGHAMGSRLTFDYEIDYPTYLASGIVIMYVYLQAFTNSTSSIIISKYRMNIVDVITYPIPRWAVVMSYGLGGMVRGLVVGISMWVVTLFFVSPMWSAPLYFLVSISFGALLFSLVGTWIAFFCKTFDQISIYTNFVVTPVLFLSDIFFPIRFFPSPWKELSEWNPIVYFVKTARYGLTGFGSEANPVFFVVCPMIIGMFVVVCVRQLRVGIKLR